MKYLKNTKHFLFDFSSYKQGVLLHLVVLFLYTSVSIALHFLIAYKIAAPAPRTYYQLWLSKMLVVLMLLHLLACIMFRKKQSLQLLHDYFTEKGSAYNLAIFRIVFFYYLGGHLIYQVFKNGITYTYLPQSSRSPIPYMGWVVEHLPVNPGIFTVVSIIGGVLSFMVCIGLFSRQASLLLLPFALYALGVPMFFGKINHYHIFLWVPVICCFSPMADVWSFDALLKKKTSAEPSVKYMLPFKIIWIQLVIIYVFAGVVKLWDCGLNWALGDNMVNQMRWEWVEHYDGIPAFRLDNYPALAKAGGLLVIFFELLYFFLVLKPSARIWAFIGGSMLHLLSGYFMYIDFSNLRMVAISYIDWEKVAAFLKSRQRRVKPVEFGKFDNLVNSKSLRLTFITGMCLVGLNFLCSLFRIHSYPFSSYPTYSGLVTDRISTIRMDAFDANNNAVNVKQLGKTAAYRWETVRPFEMRIAEAYEKGDTVAVKSKLMAYWEMWKNNIKELQKVKRVDMYLETTSVVPEERHKILSVVFLGTLNP